MIKKNAVIFSVTDFCNAKCKTCSFWKTKKATHPVKDDIKTIVHNIRNSLHCGFLSITGGEPLTYPYLIDLIKEAKSKKIVVQLMTNGYLLNKEKIKQLSDAGLDFIAFSVDHYDEDIVFENRELPNLLEKIKENLTNLEGSGIITQGGITITKQSINELGKIADFALNVLKVDVIYFSLPIKLSNSTYKLGNDEYDAIELSNQVLIDAVDEIITLKRKFGNKISHNSEFFKDMKKFYLGEKQKYPCKAGENVFYLDNFLNVYDCMIKNTKLGKITDTVKPFKNIQCTDCAMECFREGSMFYHGIKSVPLYIEQLLNRNLWKLIRK